MLGGRCTHRVGHFHSHRIASAASSWVNFPHVYSSVSCKLTFPGCSHSYHIVTGFLSDLRNSAHSGTVSNPRLVWKLCSVGPGPTELYIYRSSTYELWPPPRVPRVYVMHYAEKVSAVVGTGSTIWRRSISRVSTTVAPINTQATVNAMPNGTAGTHIIYGHNH